MPSLLSCGRLLVLVLCLLLVCVLHFALLDLHHLGHYLLDEPVGGASPGGNADPHGGPEPLRVHFQRVFYVVSPDTGLLRDIRQITRVGRCPPSHNDHDINISGQSLDGVLHCRCDLARCRLGDHLGRTFYDRRQYPLHGLGQRRGLGNNPPAPAGRQPLDGRDIADNLRLGTREAGHRAHLGV